jgi:hypothetical protein
MKRGRLRRYLARHVRTYSAVTPAPTLRNRRASSPVTRTVQISPTPDTVRRDQRLRGRGRRRVNSTTPRDPGYGSRKRMPPTTVSRSATPSLPSWQTRSIDAASSGRARWPSFREPRDQ